MLKREKIEETFDDFLEDHPELSIITDRQNHTLKVIFPFDADQTSYTIFLGEVVQLSYFYQGNFLIFP